MCMEQRREANNSRKQRNKNNAENHKTYSEDQCSEAQRGSAERSTQHGAAINTATAKTCNIAKTEAKRTMNREARRSARLSWPCL